MSTVVNLKVEAATFEDFWRLYPKKVGKPLARAKWQAITGEGLKTRTLDRDSGHYVEIELEASPEELVEGVRRYAKEVARAERRYICHPGTWLNQGRWMDEGEARAPITEADRWRLRELTEEAKNTNDWSKLKAARAEMGLA